MNVRYSLPVKLIKKSYRKLRPIWRAPWTAGPISDICALNLVPPQKLIYFFESCLLRLKRIKGATCKTVVPNWIRGVLRTSVRAGETRCARFCQRLQLFGEIGGTPPVFSPTWRFECRGCAVWSGAT
jgi:hypothetical protein